jgi:hypothetical protein
MSEFAGGNRDQIRAPEEKTSCKYCSGLHLPTARRILPSSDIHNAKPKQFRQDLAFT